MADPSSGDDFEAFWRSYPRGDGKATARRKWSTMTARQRSQALDALPLHVQRWNRERRERSTIPHATTWLNQERYADDIGAESAAAVASDESTWDVVNDFHRASQREWEETNRDR